MATLVLGAVGSVIGGTLIPGGLSLFGAAISGAAIGSAVGSIAGGFVDQALLGPLANSSGQTSIAQGPRLFDLKLGASTEGAVLPRVYGRARLPGQLIWATRFRQEIETTRGRQTGSGKNLFSSPGPSPRNGKVEEFFYYANAAYAICEGPITRIGRIWADGKELNQARFAIRVYRGDETQAQDGLIAAKEGGSNLAPSYRGTAYVAFDNMPLADFGNRLPQLNFEVFRAVDDFEASVRAVTLIPSAGEFVYEKDRVIRVEGGTTIAENLHTALGGTDWKVAIDQLQDQLPNAGHVSLVVSWFGTDLRIGHCELKPGVEVDNKDTEPHVWSVAGVTRNAAYVVSEIEGRPAYGGTPSDASVISAIQDLKARGLSVTFYPFISMDVAQGNALPNPYTGETGQPDYPWRGRIPARRRPGSRIASTRRVHAPSKSPPLSATPLPLTSSPARARCSTPARRSGRIAASFCTTRIFAKRQAESTLSSSARSCAAPRHSDRVRTSFRSSTRLSNWRQMSEACCGRKRKSPMPRIGPSIAVTSRKTEAATSIFISIRSGLRP
jgi:hypothetical protein